MNRIVDLLCGSLFRQAAVHGAQVTAEQALPIVRNLAMALLAEAVCPDCAGPITYRGERLVVCADCGRVAFQFSDSQSDIRIDKAIQNC